jgi:thymidylate synthase (FAD)
MITSRPKLFLVARPTFDMQGFDTFLEAEGETWQRTQEATESENLVEAAGRLCYMSFGAKQYRKDNKKYVFNLIIQGHESVLEHINWSFILTGVSRGFSHQLVRHRVGFAFSQLSQQYHDEKDAHFVEPSIIARFPHLADLWRHSVEGAKHTYQQLLAFLETDDFRSLSQLEKREFQRAIRTAARSVLPNATETKVFITANARAIRHFLAIRGGLPGDEEMRIVSALILTVLSKEAPSLFADFVIETMQDGTPIVRRTELK